MHKFSKIFARAWAKLLKKNESTQKRERESCVCRLVVSFFFEHPPLNKIK